MKTETLRHMLAACAACQHVVRLVDLVTGEERLIDEGDAPAADDDRLPAFARAALQDGRSRCVEDGAKPMFLQVLQPAPRLIIVGAVHIAQTLAVIAGLAGFAVTIIDPRRGFTNRPGFEGIRIESDWPDEALARLAPDGRTAIVTLTHDPKLDDPALAAGLASPAFYVGALGSRRTQADRRARLAAKGFAEADLQRIHGPVGLPLGAVTAAEIAVSIIADIIQVRRTGAAT